MQKKAKLLKRSEQDAIWEIAHQRNAKRVLNLMIELQGLWVKLGQYLSIQAHILPKAYTNAFRQLQDSLPPRPLKEVSYAHKWKFHLHLEFFDSFSIR